MAPIVGRLPLIDVDGDLGDPRGAIELLPPPRIADTSESETYTLRHTASIASCRMSPVRRSRPRDGGHLTDTELPPPGGGPVR